MNIRKLEKVFDQIKRETGMEYAIVNADEYGDCSKCVNMALAEKFGMHSKGIWAKIWTTGINADPPLEYLQSVYIAHDLEREQADIMVKILKENGYKLDREDYDSSQCYMISET